MKVWDVKNIDKNEVRRIRDELGLPAFLSILLSIRNLKTYDEINSFLSDSIEISDPFEIKDMDKAVERIKLALENEEKICVYGDYDADGVTSTALLYSYLETLGADVMYYIPTREGEGYGLNNVAIDALSDKGVSLIITVDNGVTYLECVEYAKKLQIDVVITDHHKPPEVLPDAVAVVDPHRSDCKSKFKYYAGVGVTFMLIYALEGKDCDILNLLDNYSDLVAIGTIGDIVSLTKENRTFVKYGIESIKKSDRLSINSIAKEAGINLDTIKSGSIAFGIVPRINAVGRLKNTNSTVEFLISENEYETDLAARELSEINSERQRIEKQITDNIIEYINNNKSILHDKILVINGKDWHEGVIGISCARIKDLYGKPTIIITETDGIAKGSARSIEGFSIIDAIDYCGDLLEKHGGHPMAAGLSLKPENIDKFKEKINSFVENKNMPFDTLSIDCKLNPKNLDVEMAHQIKYLEPFGVDNKEPIFMIGNLELSEIYPISNNKHLRLIFKRDNIRLQMLKFSCPKENFPYKVGDILDVAFTMGVNVYNNVESLSLIIKDIKFSDVDNEKILTETRLFESFMKDINISDIKYLQPTWDDFALVYRYLRSEKADTYYLDSIYKRIGNESLNISKLLVVFSAMEELKLIKTSIKGNEIKIELLECKEKVNLESADIMKKFKK